VSNENPKVLYIKTGPTFTLDLLRQFKARCARLGWSMTEVLALLIREWLRRTEQ